MSRGMRTLGESRMVFLLVFHYLTFICCFVQTFSHSQLARTYLAPRSGKLFNWFPSDSENCEDYNGAIETLEEGVTLTVRTNYSCFPGPSPSDTAAGSCLFNVIHITTYSTDGSVLHEFNCPVEEDGSRFNFVSVGSGRLTVEYLLHPNPTRCQVISSNLDQQDKKIALPANCSQLYAFNDQQVCASSIQKPECCCTNSSCSSDCCCGPTCSNGPMDTDYRMATEIAITAAIIVAIAILLALIWNTIKRRVPDTSRLATSRPRASMDSMERFVHERLRNRPPPYSSDADKPPAYEDSLNDPTTPPTSTWVAGERSGSIPPQPFSRSPSENDTNYDNEAFDVEELLPIPSISRTMDEPRPSLDSYGDEIIFHL